MKNVRAIFLACIGLGLFAGCGSSDLTGPNLAGNDDEDGTTSLSTRDADSGDTTAAGPRPWDDLKYRDPRPNRGEIDHGPTGP